MAGKQKSWQGASTIISTATKENIMSMKLTNQDGSKRKTAVMAERNGSILESWQAPAQDVKQNQPAGRSNILAMTESEAADLLARIQDICAVYPDSHNKIIGDFLLVALPIPPAMTYSKLVMAEGKTVFCVNGKPVTAVMAGEK